MEASARPHGAGCLQGGERGTGIPGVCRLGRHARLHPLQPWGAASTGPPRFTSTRRDAEMR